MSKSHENPDGSRAVRVAAAAGRGARWRAALVAAAIGATALGCRDVLVQAPAEPPPAVPVSGDSTLAPRYFEAVRCTVTVHTGAVDCGGPPQEGGSADGSDKVQDLIVGGQGKYIHLGITGAIYNHDAQQFTMNVRVRNLIGQPLGTGDGTSLDAKGVRVFFATAPLLRTGTGSVRVIPDGHHFFTAGEQPYYQYNSIIPQFAETGPKIWTFSMPPTVTSYTFTAYVSAVVPFPDGWIEVSPPTFMLRPNLQLDYTTRVLDVVGDPVTGNLPLTWTISDTTRAIMAGGTVTGLRAGSADVTVTSGSRTGKATLNVSGITRVWTGAVSTQWGNPDNWQGPVAPVPADSVLIPAAGPPPNYPALTQNQQITGLTIENGATLSIGSFDLTATGNVSTGTSGGVDGTVGRVFLAGIGRTVKGVLPRIRVTGTYALDGNLTLRAPLRVDAGRLRNQSFRIRVQSF
jgi:hypothetical protein